MEETKHIKWDVGPRGLGTGCQGIEVDGMIPAGCELREHGVELFVASAHKTHAQAAIQDGECGEGAAAAGRAPDPWL